MGTEETVLCNGVGMAESRARPITAARRRRSRVIAGQEFERVRYGGERPDWGAGNGPGHDCAVVKGQFHVPGCDVGRCPRCGGQAITCDCLGEG